MSNETKILKLVTGEWVVSEVGHGSLQSGATTVTLKFPMQVHIVPQGNQYGLALLPFNPTNPEGDFHLNSHSIVGESEPTKELSDAYMRQRSGIEIVSSLPGAIIGA
jgi:hypothetical protein